uniref:Uncharacterized protein n=1 Tax=Anguilla anguilla TaxID=7936 RepID=A0A0E9XV78_ANGAN
MFWDLRGLPQGHTAGR